MQSRPINRSGTQSFHLRKTEDPTPTRLTPGPGFQDRSPLRCDCFIFLFCAEDKGFEPSSQLSSGTALAVQRSKPISAYPPAKFHTLTLLTSLTPFSRLSPLSHPLPPRASSRIRTGTFSLEDCNAAVTPYSPFNVGRTHPQRRFFGVNQIVCPHLLVPRVGFEPTLFPL